MQDAVANKPAAETWRRLGILRRKEDRLAEAEAMYLRAIERDPSLAEAHYNLGNLYFALLRYDPAAEEYGKVLNLRADHAGAYRNLGDLHMEQGRYEAAAQVWSRGLRLVPGEVIFYYGLGQAGGARPDRRSRGQLSPLLAEWKFEPAASRHPAATRRGIGGPAAMKGWI